MTREQAPLQQSKTTPAMSLEKLLDMKFKARLVLGGSTMQIADILNLGEGAVLELDTEITAPLQLWVNDRFIANAESVVINEHFGARITEIASTSERLKHMADVE